MEPEKTKWKDWNLNGLMFIYNFHKPDQFNS